MSFIIGLFPLPCDFRFTETSRFDTPYSLIGGTYQQDQRPYNDSDMGWQTKKPYSQKRAFTDNCTVLVQTNTYDATPVYPALFLESATASIALSFSGSPYQFGAQRIAGNYYTDPITNTQYQLDSFQWKFRFDQLVSAPTESGIYRLRMRIYGNTALTQYREYVSEPIFVYTQHLYTTLIEATYNTNRSKEGIIAGGWSYGDTVTVQHRVEGFCINYEPQSVNVGYLSQSYLYLQQLAQSWRTWIYALGGISTGVPAYLHEKVSKAFESDIWKIDGKYFSLNNSDSTSVSKLWQNTAPTASNLRWATIPVRERFSNQSVFVNETPDPELLILTPDSFPYALIPWSLATDGGVFSFNAAVVEDSAAQIALVGYWNTLGLAGTFYISSGSIYYSSTTASIWGDFQALYNYFTAEYTGGLVGGNSGFMYSGTTARMVIDWADGSSVQFAGSVVTETPITHTFSIIGTALYAVRMFHNNQIPSLKWYENNVVYPVTTVKINNHYGELPIFMGQFTVRDCASYGTLAYGLDFTQCANFIQAITIRNCVNYTMPTTFLNISMPLLSDLRIQCNLAATEVDAVFNDFVSTVWNGTLTGGQIDTQQVTPVPPTAASLTSRNTLTSATWVILID